mmetsp:Transcript_100778/g.308117  ORF Transcript_100778/g.308117 Transcript_100778/m.308117 type:complete len:205 (-) Transcript_100778:130-744(-)
MTLSTSWVMSLSLLCRTSALFLKRAENWICSRQVRSGWTMSSCGTKPVTVLNFEMPASSPFTRTLPVTRPCLAFPLSTDMNVVFPAPEGPMIAQRRPALNSPVTPSSTRLPLEPPQPPGSSRPKSSNSTVAAPALIWRPRNWYFSTLKEGMKWRTRFSENAWLSFIMPDTVSQRLWLFCHLRSPMKIRSTPRATAASHTNTPTL